MISIISIEFNFEYNLIITMNTLHQSLYTFMNISLSNLPWLWIFRNEQDKYFKFTNVFLKIVPLMRWLQKYGTEGHSRDNSKIRRSFFRCSI